MSLHGCFVIGKLVRELIYYYAFIKKNSLKLCYKQEIDAPASADVNAHPRAEEHKALPDSETKLLHLNKEGGGDDDGDDDNDDNDNENEVPYFSDAETMVSIICCTE